MVMQKPHSLVSDAKESIMVMQEPDAFLSDAKEFNADAKTLTH
jgi:hypothetical protein